jgi:hypothetical protein
MARRSLGVVLIVALVSWTVNWLTFGCESQHSRAAVVVPAGASPAYQPEPSPSRHTCCPQVKSLSFSRLSLSSRPCYELLLLPPPIANARPPRLLVVPTFAYGSPHEVPDSAPILTKASRPAANFADVPGAFPLCFSPVLRLGDTSYSDLGPSRCVRVGRLSHIKKDSKI